MGILIFLNMGIKLQQGGFCHQIGYFSLPAHVFSCHGFGPFKRRHWNPALDIKKLDLSTQRKIILKFGLQSQSFKPANS